MKNCNFQVLTLLTTTQATSAQIAATARELHTIGIGTTDTLKFDNEIKCSSSSLAREYLDINVASGRNS